MRKNFLVSLFLFLLEICYNQLCKEAKAKHGKHIRQMLFGRVLIFRSPSEFSEKIPIHHTFLSDVRLLCFLYAFVFDKRTQGSDQFRVKKRRKRNIVLHKIMVQGGFWLGLQEGQTHSGRKIGRNSSPMQRRFECGENHSYPWRKQPIIRKRSPQERMRSQAEESLVLPYWYHSVVSCDHHQTGGMYHGIGKSKVAGSFGAVCMKEV